MYREAILSSRPLYTW